MLVLKEDIGAYTVVWPVNFWKKLPAKSGIIASSLDEDFKTKKVDSERDERRVSRDKEKKLPAGGKVATDIATEQAQVTGSGWFSSPVGVNNVNNPFKPGGSIFAGQTGSIFSKPQTQAEMSKRPARKAEKNEASAQGFMLNSKPKYHQTPVVGEDETLKILGRLGESLYSPGFQSQGHTPRTAFSEFVSPGILATGKQAQIPQAKYPWDSPWAGALTPSTQVSSSPFVQNQNPFHSANNLPISSFTSSPQTPVMISIPQNKWSSGVNSYGIPESPDQDPQPADKPIDNPFARFNDNPPDTHSNPTLTGQNFLNLKKAPTLNDKTPMLGSPGLGSTLQNPFSTANQPYQPPIK